MAVLLPLSVGLDINERGGGTISSPDNSRVRIQLGQHSMGWMTDQYWRTWQRKTAGVSITEKKKVGGE